MRIDVMLHRDIEAELAALHTRMQRPGDPLHRLPTIVSGLRDIVFRYREVDGEFFLYVEDAAARRLAGITVFQRVPDIDGRAARFLRSPHSRYASAYQRQGLGSAVYRWALLAGMCLISGPRQSGGAHRLWLSLAQTHDLLYVQVRDRALRCFGPEVGPDRFGAFDTRMVLLGAGWCVERLERHATPGRTSQPDERK